MRSMFVRVQIAVEGEGWMVRAIEKCCYCIFERKGCVQTASLSASLMFKYALTTYAKMMNAEDANHRVS